MKILIDIGHPAQFNFYKKVIEMLSINNSVIVTYVKRGKLPAIIQQEIGQLENCTLIEIGHHKGTKLSAVFESNIIRPIQLFYKMVNFNPDVELSNGYQAAIYPKLFRKRSIHFNDDFDKSFIFKTLMKIFADQIYVPFFLEKSKKVMGINSLKEWAYLSPKYFTPNPSILDKYRLEENNYFFIREVITGTLNYSNQESHLIEFISKNASFNIPVVLSLEDKSRKDEFPKNWHIIQEPEKDIHSLMYYSKILLSSGDSMAREGALLGVPSIYCGVREMDANKILIDKGMLFKVSPKDVSGFIGKLKNGEIKLSDQTNFRENLLEEWEDIPEFICKKIIKKD